MEKIAGQQGEDFLRTIKQQPQSKVHGRMEMQAFLGNHFVNEHVVQ